jgi:diadenosine tetraphosphate (Ap4A) HIT family hydrolase
MGWYSLPSASSGGLVGWISGSAGIFKLHESDDWCGSMMSTQDAAEILGVEAAALADIPTTVIDGELYLNERDVYVEFCSGRIPGAPPAKAGVATISFDEMVLRRLIEITLPDAVVDQQVQWGRKRVDLRVTTPNSTKMIEFDGPTHFRQAKPLSPLERRDAIQQAFGCECVIWPFWIQRCARNVRALFDPEVEGVASVWSTGCFFGEFVLEDSEGTIIELTERFRAVRPEGIGYMYESGRGVRKPEHPILGRIRGGKGKPENLVPPKARRSRNFWLPREFWKKEPEVEQVEGCPFCDVEPGRVLCGNPEAYAIRDRYPVNPGHTLVIPHRHVASWFEATDEEKRGILELVDRVRSELEEQEPKPDGYNLGVNVGAAAGQTVGHLHMHVIPRFAGDVEDPRGGVRGVIPDRRSYFED